MDYKERTETNNEDHRTNDASNNEVRRHRTEPRLPSRAHEAERHTVTQHEEIYGSKAEHDGRMPVKSVAEAPPARACQVLRYGKGRHVADAAAIEITRCRVMNRVATTPMIVRRERQNGAKAARIVVAPSVWEKGSVPAIVLDHKHTHQKRGRRQEEQCVKPILAAIQREEHQAPRERKRYQRDRELVSGAHRIRFAVPPQLPRPTALIELRRSAFSGLRNGYHSRPPHSSHRPSSDGKSVRSIASVSGRLSLLRAHSGLADHSTRCRQAFARLSALARG